VGRRCVEFLPTGDADHGRLIRTLAGPAHLERAFRGGRCSPYPTELEVLREILPQIQTPVQVISGRKDRVVPPINAEYLHERLPRSELRLIDSGHFIWEDAADEYAALVNAWWGGGFKIMTLDAVAGRTGQANQEAV
jgi:pimeloyl-ACP methyl ester carboxylesterase